MSTGDTKLNESVSTSKGRKKKTKDDYEFLKKDGKDDLGKGSYGYVRLARDKSSGELVAIKIMSKKAIFEYSNKENLKREINIQRSINHPHITRLYNYFEDQDNVYLVLEYCENGSLFHYLRRKKKFPEDESFIYFFQTCLGIDYLHKKKIIHRDLKPENLLLDNECNVKLCDFGWSAEELNKRSTFCGTIDYMAPEMIKNQPHDHRLDIWCLGVLLYEMLHVYAPFKGKTDHEKCQNIARMASLQFDPGVSTEAIDIIRKILKPAPSDRISMESIFKHPFMKKWEKHYQIDIIQYISTGDEDEIKNSIGTQSSNQNPSLGSTSNNAKIITIVDETSPFKYGKDHQDRGITNEVERMMAKLSKQPDNFESNVYNKLEDTYNKKNYAHSTTGDFGGAVNLYKISNEGYRGLNSFGDASTIDSQSGLRAPETLAYDANNDDIARIINRRGGGRKITGGAQISSNNFIKGLKSERSLSHEYSTKFPGPTGGKRAISKSKKKK